MLCLAERHKAVGTQQPSIGRIERRNNLPVLEVPFINLHSQYDGLKNMHVSRNVHLVPWRENGQISSTLADTHSSGEYSGRTLAQDLTLYHHILHPLTRVHDGLRPHQHPVVMKQLTSK